MAARLDQRPQTGITVIECGIGPGKAGDCDPWTCYLEALTAVDNCFGLHRQGSLNRLGHRFASLLGDDRGRPEGRDQEQGADQNPPRRLRRFKGIRQRPRQRRICNSDVHAIFGQERTSPERNRRQYGGQVFLYGPLKPDNAEDEQHDRGYPGSSPGGVTPFTARIAEHESKEMVREQGENATCENRSYWEEDGSCTADQVVSSGEFQAFGINPEVAEQRVLPYVTEVVKDRGQQADWGYYAGDEIHSRAEATFPDHRRGRGRLVRTGHPGPDSAGDTAGPVGLGVMELLVSAGAGLEPVGVGLMVPVGSSVGDGDGVTSGAAASTCSSGASVPSRKQRCPGPERQSGVPGR